MKKKIISIVLTIICLMTFLYSPITVSANKSTQQKLNETQEEIKNKNSDLESTSNEADKLSKEIESFDNKISKLNQDIEDQEVKRTKVEKALAKSKEELKKAKKEKEKYKKVFDERMKVMYMYGDTGYLDIIFSSEGISDLLNNISNYKDLVTYDQNIISELQKAENKISSETAKISSNKKELDGLIAKLKTNKEDLDVLKAAKDRQLTDTNEDLRGVKEQLDILQKEADELNDKLYEENMKKHGNYSKGDPGTYGRGRKAILNVARAQIGNYGGQKFWSWYGFNYRVSWCACFVSWCANQAGYLRSGTIPKFSYVDNGANWFKSRGRWQGRNYTPRGGDIIFFDWDGNGVGNHVGIVESVSGGVVNTIEGNSSDACRRRSYSIGSWNIMGYGVPNY